MELLCVILFLVWNPVETQIQIEIGRHKKAGVLDLCWGNALVTPTEVHLLFRPSPPGNECVVGGKKAAKTKPMRAPASASVPVCTCPDGAHRCGSRNIAG